MSCQNQATKGAPHRGHVPELWQGNANTAEREGAPILSELTPGKKRFVKRMLTTESPTIRIGKCGVSEQTMDQVDKQLSKSTMVKVKVLKTALKDCDTKEIAGKIAHQTGAALVEVRGHTFMLYRRRRK